MAKAERPVAKYEQIRLRGADYPCEGVCCGKRLRADSTRELKEKAAKVYANRGNEQRESILLYVLNGKPLPMPFRISRHNNVAEDGSISFGCWL